MFRAMIPPIFRSTRLCVTACGIMQPRIWRPVTWKGGTPLPSYRQSTSCVHYTTTCNTQSSASEDGRDHRPKHVELTEIINKSLLLHLVGVYIIYIKLCTVKQISNISAVWKNEIFLVHICGCTLHFISSQSPSITWAVYLLKILLPVRKTIYLYAHANHYQMLEQNYQTRLFVSDRTSIYRPATAHKRRGLKERPPHDYILDGDLQVLSLPICWKWRNSQNSDSLEISIQTHKFNRFLLRRINLSYIY